MAGDCCRGCDGSGESRVLDKLNVLRGAKVSKCSRCSGSGTEPGPSKGGKRRFGSKQKKTDEELTLEQKADAFLASRGFSRGGR
jgi:hypothetical protein